MHKKTVIYMLLLLLAFPLGSSAILAAEAPSFSLTASEESLEAGQELRIAVTGERMEDLYGFELNLRYDAERLRFKSAGSPIEGFSVPPIAEEGQVMFSHTKIGRATPGDNGTVRMAEFVFEGLAEGAASIELGKVKLVSSKVEVTEPATGQRIGVSVEPASIMAFSDIDGHWARANILEAAALGLVNGYPDGTFRPQDHVTRAEFAAMLVRALGLPEPAAAISFADLEQIPEWARPAIARSVSAGIITGYEDNTFRAAKSITRDEMTVMIAKALGLEAKAGQPTGFADDDQIAEWAKGYIAVAAEEGIVQGRGGNRFVPNAGATRAEAVTLMLALRAGE